MRKLHSYAFLITAFICFLPFMDVKCDSSKVTFSGVQLALGGGTYETKGVREGSELMSVKKLGRSPWMIGFIVCVAAGLALSVFRPTDLSLGATSPDSKRISFSIATLLAILASICMTIQFFFSDFTRMMSDAGDPIEVNYRYGLYLAIVGLCACIGTGISFRPKADPDVIRKPAKQLGPPKSLGIK